MFPSGSEGFDVSQLMQQAQRMQEQFQQNLSDAEVTGTAGGGLVSATVDGTGELVSLDIDPSVVDPDDVETLADLVVAAVRDGQSQVQRLMAEQMGSLGSMLGALGAGDAASDLPDELPGDKSDESAPERE